MIYDYYGQKFDTDEEQTIKTRNVERHNGHAPRPVAAAGAAAAADTADSHASGTNGQQGSATTGTDEVRALMRLYLAQVTLVTDRHIEKLSDASVTRLLKQMMDTAAAADRIGYKISEIQLNDILNAD